MQVKQILHNEDGLHGHSDYFKEIFTFNAARVKFMCLKGILFYSACVNQLLNIYKSYKYNFIKNNYR